MLAHAQDVAALTDVVLHIIIGALVGQLGQPDLLGGELLIQVVEVEAGRGQLLEGGRENGGLEGGHGGFKLRRDQGQRLVLDSHLRVELDGFGDEVGVELVEALVEEGGEVARQLVRLLQTRAQAVGEGGDVGHVHVLGELGLVLDGALELGVRVGEQPLEDGLLDLLVVFLLEELVLEERDRPQHEQLAPLRTHVEGGHGAVGGVAHGARGEDGEAGLAHVQRRAVGVHEGEAPVLVAAVQVVLGVAVTLRELALAADFGLLGFAGGDPGECVI